LNFHCVDKFTWVPVHTSTSENARDVADPQISQPKPVVELVLELHVIRSPTWRNVLFRAR
jgi:hypothetical protein